MIARFGGGNNGIAEYLETGMKAQRDHTRDELDQRVVLDGNLSETNRVIQSITDKGQERYLHITLSFGESEISKETLGAIVEDYKTMFMAAYDKQEYSFYAEAHLPKIKSLPDNRTGELIERKPHIHIVIPRTNLASGKSMNPRGDLTNKPTQLMLDAIQEKINDKYHLASPKDAIRVSEDNYPSVLSRAKGDTFKERQGELKRDIFKQVENQDIRTTEKFRELLTTFGEVKERNAGKDNAYFAVKFNGDDKFTNLKNPIFSTPFIERRELPLTKPTETQIKNRVDTWINQKSLEIKHIYPSSAKNREVYKNIPDNQQKQTHLRTLENDHRERYGLQTKAGRQTDKQRDPSQFGSKIDANRSIGLSHMPQCSLVYGLRGHDRSAPERVLSANENGDLAKHRDKNEAIHSPVRWREHNGAGAGGINKIENSSVAYDILFSALNERAAENEKEVFAEIRKNIDPIIFMATVQRDFNTDPNQHQITTAKDGSPRFSVGERNLNASDFLTKHINLPWQEAKDYLIKVYAEQQAGKELKPEKQGSSKKDMLDRAESLKACREYVKGAISAEKQQAKDKIKQIRSEMKGLTKKEKEISKGLIAYVKITSKEISENTKVSGRNFINQYHTNWNEGKDQMRAMSKLSKALKINEENSISSGNESLTIRDLLDQEKKARAFGKLNDLVLRKSESKLEYRDPETKKNVFVDRGSKVTANSTDPAAVGIMLDYAKEKFGGVLKLNGSEEFKTQCAMVAAEKGMNIILKPDEYQAMMEDRKAELAASISQGSHSRELENQENSIQKAIPEQNKATPEQATPEQATPEQATPEKPTTAQLINSRLDNATEMQNKLSESLNDSAHRSAYDVEFDSEHRAVIDADIATLKSIIDENELTPEQAQRWEQVNDLQKELTDKESALTQVTEVEQEQATPEQAETVTVTEVEQEQATPEQAETVTVTEQEQATPEQAETVTVTEIEQEQATPEQAETVTVTEQEQATPEQAETVTVTDTEQEQAIPVMDEAATINRLNEMAKILHDAQYLNDPQAFDEMTTPIFKEASQIKDDYDRQITTSDELTAAYTNYSNESWEADQLSAMYHAMGLYDENQAVTVTDTEQEQATPEQAEAVTVTDTEQEQTTPEIDHKVEFDRSMEAADNANFESYTAAMEDDTEAATRAKLEENDHKLTAAKHAMQIISAAKDNEQKSASAGNTEAAASYKAEADQYKQEVQDRLEPQAKEILVNAFAQAYEDKGLSFDKDEALSDLKYMSVEASEEYLTNTLDKDIDKAAAKEAGKEKDTGMEM
ncbi:MAG: LPD7 domain-containing protein [Aeromonas sp.]